MPDKQNESYPNSLSHLGYLFIANNQTIDFNYSLYVEYKRNEKIEFEIYDNKLN